MIDTHGLKMEGLIDASAETKYYGRDGRYVEIFYDRSTGEIWTKFQFSLGMQNWTEYKDPNIIKIGNSTTHISAQKLADIIADKVALNDEADRIMEQEYKKQKAWEEEIEKQYNPRA